MNPNSLVLYKSRPAIVKQAGDRLEIETENGQIAKVRPKDVTLLHPGPVSSLRELRPEQGEIEEVWDMLAGTTTNLHDLAEWIFGAYTPSTAWAAWQLLSEGLYFHGLPDNIVVATAEEIDAKKVAADAHAANAKAWNDFLSRTKKGEYDPADHRYLKDTEELALGKPVKSRVLKELGREQSPENAHALLLQLGVWDETVNPYPERLGIVTTQPCLPVPDPPDEDRLDLTYLESFAIDDEATDTPDDAIALDGSRLWVHIADVAAMALPGGPLDIEAQSRASSLHLPEGTINMLPREAVEKAGLGFQDASPALSFGLDMNPDGSLAAVQVALSRVRAQRLTYDQAESRLAEEPFRSLQSLTRAALYRRIGSGAIGIDFPEVDVVVRNGRPELKPILPLQSRLLVQEAMILTGEAGARLALENDIPVPFTTQEVCEATGPCVTLAEMFALRRCLRRRQYSSKPGRHGGLGLDAYVQTTSPLRRYLDLVVHQQFRAFLTGGKLLDSQAVLERVGAAEAMAGSLRKAENLSNKHWLIVYLMQHPDWTGEGIVVDRRGPSGIVLIPELGMETTIRMPASILPDCTVRLSLSSVNLPLLQVFFRLVQ